MLVRRKITRGKKVSKTPQDALADFVMLRLIMPGVISK
jgi:hypothetical protein